MEKESRQQLLTLIKCCLCIGGAVGLMSNSIGIFYTPIAENLGIGRGDVALTITIMSLCAGFYSPMFVKLRNKFSLNVLMSVGVIFSIIAYLIMSVAKDIKIFYACGILLGIGSASYAALPVSIILRDWYGEKNGSKLGIAMAFSGLVAAILNPLLGNIITNYGYQIAFRFCAIFLAVICLPCTLTMKLKNPDADKQVKDNKKDSSIAISTSIIFLFLAGISFYGQNGMNSHISSLAISAGYTLAFSASVVSTQSIMNTLFKLCFGFIADHIGSIKAVILYIFFGFTGTVLMAFFRSVPILMALGAGMYSANFSISTIGTSLLTQKAAGDNYADVYSKLTVFTTASYAIMTTVYGKLFDLTGTYQICLFIVMTLSMIGLLMIQLLNKKS